MINKINPAYLSAVAIIASGIMFAAKMQYDIAILKDDIKDYAEEQEEVKTKLDTLTNVLLGFNLKEISYKRGIPNM